MIILQISSHWYQPNAISPSPFLHKHYFKLFFFPQIPINYSGHTLFIEKTEIFVDTPLNFLHQVYQLICVCAYSTVIALVTWCGVLPSVTGNPPPCPATPRLPSFSHLQPIPFSSLFPLTLKHVWNSTIPPSHSSYWILLTFIHRQNFHKNYLRANFISLPHIYSWNHSNMAYARTIPQKFP